MIAGFAAARGEFVVTIDADLQNPPEEIPRLVAEFEKGHDLVGTIRVGRQDTLVPQAAPRKLVNYMTRRMSGIKLHDFGCMLRGYSREIVKIDRRARRDGHVHPGARVACTRTTRSRSRSSTRRATRASRSTR